MFVKKLTAAIGTFAALSTGVLAAPAADAATSTHTVTRTGTASTIVLKLTGFTPQAALSVEAAANYWSNHLASDVPIVVDLDWKTLGAGQGGQAGPAHYELNTPGAERGYAYPKSIANALAGSNLTPNANDITGQFNAAADWSLDPVGPVAGKTDLQSVATHELGHGLGLVTDLRYGGDCASATVGCYGSRQGTNPETYQFPYETDRFVATAPPGSGHTLLSDANNSNELATDLRPAPPAGLFWNGAHGVAGAGGGPVRLYAPTNWEQGSSGGAHLDEATYPSGNDNALMTPGLHVGEAERQAGPIVLGMMEDIGWTVRTSNEPLATNRLLYSTDGGVHWSTHPTVAPGAKLRVRAWYDNQDSKVANSVSVRTALPAGFRLVPASTEVCMSPATSRPEDPDASLDFCAKPRESAVWSNRTLTVSPTNGLKIDAVTSQSTTLTRGILEPGRGFAEFEMIAPRPATRTTFPQTSTLAGVRIVGAANGRVTVTAKRAVPPAEPQDPPAHHDPAAPALPIVALPTVIDAGVVGEPRRDHRGLELLAGVLALGALGLAAPRKRR